MLTAIFLLGLSATAAVPSDSAILAGDTLRIESIGVSFTVPSFWMGRVPPGATFLAPGAGRSGCQLTERSTIGERIITDRAQLASRQRARYGPPQVYDAALDSTIPASALVAHVGAVPFTRNCIAPQVRVYVAAKTAVRPLAFAVTALREIQRQYSGVTSTRTDSAGWSIVQFAWTESRTDFIHPATLDIWWREVGDQVLILAVMDMWSGADDTAALLASFRRTAA